MTKNLTNNIIILFSVFFSIILALFIWDFIKLPFSNPNEVFGQYSQNNHNKYNDVLRILIFIWLPSITFLILYIFFNNKNCDKINNIFLINKEKIITNKNQIKNILFFLLILTSIIRFISHDLTMGKIDIFHEGHHLSGAFQNLSKKTFWIDNYLQNSLFHDILIAKFSWIISGNISIGSWRIFVQFLNLIVEIFLIILCFNISKKFEFNKNKEILFFILIAIFTLYINRNFTEYWWPTRFRDIPLILLLIFSLNLYIDNKKNLVKCFLIGSLSVLSILWSLDKGIYLNISLFLILFILLFNKKYLNIFFMLFGILLGWIIFFKLIGTIEFKFFLSNTISIINDRDLSAGLIFPKPFEFELNHSSRATKNLLIILLNNLAVIFIIFKKEIPIPKNTKLFILLLNLLAFMNYYGAIGRSDSYHMKQGIFFQFLLSSILICYWIIKIKFSIFLRKNLIILFSIILIFYQINFDKKIIFKSLNFKKRFTEYTKLSDQTFLNEDYIKLINRLNKLTKKQNCMQIFTYDLAISYLIRKKSCTKFNQIFALGSKQIQNEFINELNIKKPNLILINGPYLSWQPNINKRFKEVNTFILNNYSLGEKIANWEILYINK